MGHVRLDQVEQRDQGRAHRRLRKLAVAVHRHGTRSLPRCDDREHRELGRRRLLDAAPTEVALSQRGGCAGGPRVRAEQTGIVIIDAPPGTLGLVFKRDSTELSKVLTTSPLVDKVQVGWTLVSVNGEDVEMLDGWQTTRLLQAQAAAGRKLSFAVPAGAEVAEQPGVLGRVGAALAALSPRALVTQTPNAVKFFGENWIVGEDGGHGVPYFLSENEAHIAHGSYIRSRRTYSAPVSVTAELKADGKECFVLSLFNLATCTGHLHRLKNEGLSLENGAWGDKLRLLPGDHRETVGHATVWHSVQLSLDASGTARFYWNGQLKYTTSFPATSVGPLQFIKPTTAGGDVETGVVLVEWK